MSTRFGDYCQAGFGSHLRAFGALLYNRDSSAPPGDDAMNHLEVMQPLYDRFADVLAVMPDEFSSHAFIRELGRRHQDLYVEALYAYRESRHEGTPAPFMAVHSLLAQRLGEELTIENVGQFESRDIWDLPNRCARWRKRTHPRLF